MSVTIYTTTSYSTTVTITLVPTPSDDPAPKGDADGKEISGVVLIPALIFGIATMIACFGYYLRKRNRPAPTTPVVARGNGATAVATAIKRVALAVLRR